MNLLARLILAAGLAALLSPDSVAENRQEEGEKLVRHAEQISNLRSDDARPFRLKASFTLLGKGAVTGEGTYTEIWVSHGRWRRDTVLGTFHRTEVGVDKKGWILDSTDNSPVKTGELGRLMHVGEIRQESIKVAAIRDQSVQGVQARCVELKGDNNNIGKGKFCIDPQRGVLLLREIPVWVNRNVDYLCEYSQYEQFADRMYPRHIQCVEDGYPGIDVRVQELSVESSPDPALFAPPIGAKEVGNCSSKVQPPKALQTPDPEYPKGEPQPSSPELIFLIVGVDGKPRDLKVASSIGKLFDSQALGAVSQWVFRPAMCDGDPVAVQVNVEVTFRKP